MSQNAKKPLTDEDRMALDWMAHRFADCAKELNHWVEVHANAEVNISRVSKDAAGWKERILSVDPTYFEHDIPEHDEPAGSAKKGAKKVPYGYWSTMGERLVNTFGSGTFEQLVQSGLKSDMVDGKSREELDPLRYALHGLARRKKITLEDGVYSKVGVQMKMAVGVH